jgi:hypothetical protein
VPQVNLSCLPGRNDPILNTYFTSNFDLFRNLGLIVNITRLTKDKKDLLEPGSLVLIYRDRIVTVDLEF